MSGDTGRVGVHALEFVTYLLLERERASAGAKLPFEPAVHPSFLLTNWSANMPWLTVDQNVLLYISSQMTLLVVTDSETDSPLPKLPCQTKNALQEGEDHDGHGGVQAHAADRVCYEGQGKRWQDEGERREEVRACGSHSFAVSVAMEAENRKDGFKGGGGSQVVPVLELTRVVVSTEDHMHDGVRAHAFPPPPSGGMPSIGEICVCILRLSSVPISLLRCFCSCRTRCVQFTLARALLCHFKVRQRNTAGSFGRRKQRAGGNRDVLAEFALGSRSCWSVFFRSARSWRNSLLGRSVDARSSWTLMNCMSSSVGEGERVRRRFMEND